MVVSYDPTSDTYSYTLKTDHGVDWPVLYQVRMALRDGSLHTAEFQFE